MLLVTDAIVLHALDYLETSRILRLVTREAGVQSVLAKGVRRSRGKFGSGVDLFAEGEAQLYVKPTRDLHTLASFDIARSRAGLALDMDRFMAASALAELVLRLGAGEPNPVLYDSVVSTLDDLAVADGTTVTARALGGFWRVMAATGFSPALDQCASCHAALDPVATVLFSHAAGGALCDRCARLAPGSRALPPEPRRTIVAWLSGTDLPISTSQAARAHQRLFREFVAEHLPHDRPMRAFLAWETSLTVTN